MSRFNAFNAYAFFIAAVLLLSVSVAVVRSGPSSHPLIVAAGVAGPSPAATSSPVRDVEHPPSVTVAARHGRSVPHRTLNWNALAECESNGNWQDTAGYYQGGLQFSPTTWASFHGTDYAPTADQATKAQQIRVAERVLRRQGLAAWPACTLKLGWR